MLGCGETVAGIRMEDAPAGQQRQWLDREYPKSTARAVLELRARRQALRASPEITSVDMLVIEVLPGAAGLGIPAAVRYRPMTKQEQAAWRRKVNAAKKARK